MHSTASTPEHGFKTRRKWRTQAYASAALWHNCFSILEWHLELPDALQTEMQTYYNGQHGPVKENDIIMMDKLDQVMSGTIFRDKLSVFDSSARDIGVTISRLDGCSGIILRHGGHGAVGNVRWYPDDALCRSRCG